MSQSFAAGEAADGLGQGRELVVVRQSSCSGEAHGSGRAASWCCRARACRGEAADGIGQGRELVVEPERCSWRGRRWPRAGPRAGCCEQRLAAGEAADGLGQGRELVVVERELLQLARPPMASGRAASWLCLRFRRMSWLCASISSVGKFWRALLFGFSSRRVQIN